MSVRFGGVTAVEGVALDVQPGEIHGLIGPNGAGKTTFIDAISGFVKPTRGQVTLGGRSLTALPAHKRVALGLTRSFQTLELFEDLTVADNLRASIRPKLVSFVTGVAWPRPVPLNEGAMSAIREFGITNHLHVKPEALSYGQRRLVAIARSVATLPSVILLDEPCAGLDEVHRAELAGLLTRLAQEWGIGILVVEHDVDLILEICDRVTVLDAGCVLATGAPRDVLRDPSVVTAYLGVETAVQTLERGAHSRAR
jgi:sulfate-transporting ATPase